MGKLGWLVWMTAAVALGGCGSSIDDSTAPGPVDKGLYKDAQLDNQQRLAGEDHRVIPLYKTPLEAIGVGFDQLIGDPIAHLFDNITHDNAAYALRKMQDATSPDRCREGTLRMVDFKFARTGEYPNIYRIEAQNAQDFTVRAASLRALNRCRAKGYTSLFLESLGDDQMLVRLEAANALANIPDPESIPILKLHMGESEPSLDVRIACAEALRNFHTDEVMLALVNELDDTEFAVAWQARQSLELLTGQDYRYDAKAWRNYLATGLSG